MKFLVLFENEPYDFRGTALKHILKENIYIADSADEAVKKARDERMADVDEDEWPQPDLKNVTVVEVTGKVKSL